MGIDFEQLRKQMVEEQLVKRGIDDELVLEAFKKVKREKFLPENNKKYAYADGAQLIAAGQTISQPYIVAVMLEALEIEKTDSVLEIGTGSGYAAALLAEIAAEVYTIERIEELAVQAEELLKKLGYQNIKVKLGDGSLGWEEFAPYDSILVSAAAPYVPQKLIDQLSVGGKIVIPVGERNKVQRLKVITKKFNGKIKAKELEYVRFVPLIGKDSWR
ncbi:MAG: Protein-L-isoaspartate O-methyltransferase [Halanaerobium sp. 4-GBenrich]|jgi:protein-L-isoaspartate(D-aspartate) O-methyltransferase|uniref:Protein-L-isoaspartate O-methyltransferase n=1 Tax=Halanaerobium congolense TaxID=54121 RepID=A0A1G6RXQ0_9FIRM|nr:protein-L-isoaspartate(D-aspartate) O-methyltransferase [Halanaerobium congolense]KXS50124.1 MAG: Protein-L-isoaspartate O-methyltransferase [Halanaerobium sp. T82-1]ODS49943.1 MAG: Protein-L-isoaspartate O-methyltransferase [Halanaerobium sp. 4-GBenrich]OEG62913.1 MAG: protein-L-isoaspartate O-methyltransferase [Halanaerobium sp. MDAL1]PUU92639.1 MAG: Protein-L-isoaspartate O-methyltransferase [Halanaerobium sp.]PTX17877.1 protein-L-isoaspartate(D-aspartate) O-methyltransferase [Halanaerob